MNSKNLSKAINRMLAILLTAAMVAGSFTVPVKADVDGQTVAEETTAYADDAADTSDDVAEDVTEDKTSGETQAEPEVVTEESDELEKAVGSSLDAPEIIEEGEEDNNLIVKDPSYFHSVTITVPGFAVDGHKEKYSWTERNIKDALLDEIVITGAAGGPLSGKLNEEGKLEQDEYKVSSDGNSGEVKTAKDYSILVYKGVGANGTGGTLVTSEERVTGASGLDVGAVGRYRVEVDVHDRLGRYDGSEKFVFEVEAYKITDFKDYLTVTWSAPASPSTGTEFSPAYKNASIVPSDLNSYGVKFDQTVTYTQLQNAGFTGITEDAVYALRSNFKGDNENNAANFVQVTAVNNSENDNIYVAMGYNTSGADAGVSKTIVTPAGASDDEKPTVSIKANVNYNGTSNGKLNEFITPGSTDTTSEIKIPFTIREGVMTDDTNVIVAEAKAKELSKNSSATAINMTTSAATIAIAVSVDKDNARNSYAFDFSEILNKKIASNYAEFDSIARKSSGEGFFVNGSVKVDGSTKVGSTGKTLTFDVPGTNYSSNQDNTKNAITLSVKYTNYEAFDVKVVVTVERQDNSEGIAWAGKVAAGGLKLPYLDTGYQASGIVTTGAAATDNFGIKDGAGSDVTGTKSYTFQKKLANGYWSAATTWNDSTYPKDIGTYRAKVSNVNGDTTKVAYSPEFEIEAVEFTGATVNPGSGAQTSFAYNVNATGTEPVVDIFQIFGRNTTAKTGAITLTAAGVSKAIGKSDIGSAAAKPFDIEYFKLNPYTWDGGKAKDEVTGSDGTIIHLVTGAAGGSENKYMYQNQPYAKITVKDVDDNKNFSKKPIYITFDLKEAKDSLVEAKMAAQTISTPASKGIKMDIDLPAEMFYTDVAASARYAVDSEKVDLANTTISVSDLSVARNDDTKPITLEATKTGYKLSFYTTSACTTGSSATFKVTPKFKWPYKESASTPTVNIKVKFEDLLTVSLKKSTKVYDGVNVGGGANTTGTLGNKNFYNILIGNVPDENVTGISVAYYPQKLNPTGVANEYVYAGNGLTYDTTSSAPNVVDVGNYLIKVTGVTTTTSDVAFNGPVYLPYSITPYELTEDDIVLADGLKAANLTAEDTTMLTFEAALGMADNTTYVQVIPDLTSSGTRTFGSHNLTRDDDGTVADQYRLVFSEATKIPGNDDEFKYTATITLNGSGNYKMNGSLTKDIVAKKYDVTDTTPSTCTITLADNGKIKQANGTYAFVYDGYEKEPRVKKVVFTTGETGAQANNLTFDRADVTYAENIEAGLTATGDIILDFKNQIKFKGTYTKENQFAIVKRPAGNIVKPDPIVVEVPNAAGTTKVNLPKLFNVDMTGLASDADTKAVAAYGTVSSTALGKKAGTAITGDYTVGTNGILKLTITSIGADTVCNTIEVSPTFTNFADTNTVEVVVKGANKSQVKLTTDSTKFDDNTTAPNWKTDYTGSNITETPVIRVSASDYASGRDAASYDPELPLSLKYTWYDSDGKELKAPDNYPVDAGIYTCRVSLVENEKYLADELDLTLQVVGKAMVVEAADSVEYNGENQAVVIVKDKATNAPLTEDVDYEIEGIYENGGGGITDINSITGTNLKTGIYKDVNTYALKVVGKGNYEIRENESAEVNSGVVVNFEITAKDLTVTPKTDTLIQYRDKSTLSETKKAWILDEIADVEGLVGNEKVELTTSAVATFTIPYGTPGTPVSKTLEAKNIQGKAAPAAGETTANVLNYNIKVASPGKVSIDFKKRVVEINVKLLDAIGNPLPSQVKYTGHAIGVDAEAEVVSPILDTPISLVKNTDYTVSKPTTIIEPDEYEVSILGVDTSVYDVKEASAKFSVVNEIVVTPEISVIGMDGTDIVDKEVQWTGSSVIKEVKVTSEEFGALAENTDYTLEITPDSINEGVVTVTVKPKEGATYTIVEKSVTFTIKKDGPARVVQSVSATPNKVTLDFGKADKKTATATISAVFDVEGETLKKDDIKYSPVTSAINVKIEDNGIVTFTTLEYGDKEPVVYTFWVDGDDTKAATVAVTNKPESSTPTPGTEDEDDYTATPKDDRKDIEDLKTGVTVELKKTEYPYGKTVEPKPVVKQGKTTLKLGTDYRIIYPDSNAGEKQLIVRGMNDFKGDKTVDYKITQKKISSAKVYAGEMYENSDGLVTDTFSLLVYDGTKLLTSEDYSTNEAEVFENYTSGTKTLVIRITAEEDGNYSGYKDVKISVKKLSGKAKYIISENDVDDIGDVEFSANHKPEPVVYGNDGVTLTKGTDYTVSWANFKKAGVAYVTVKGKGEYAGKVVKSYVIETDSKDTLNDATVTVNKGKDLTYNGKLQTPSVVVANGKTLKKGTDYIVTYGKNLNASKDKEGIAYITGIGDYEGQYAVGYFRIAPINVSKVAINVKSAKDCTITYNKKVLTVDQDIAVKITKNTKGKYDIAVDGLYDNDSNEHCNFETTTKNSKKSTKIKKGIKPEIVESDDFIWASYVVE